MSSSNGTANGREAVIVIKDMTKVYQMGEHEVRALNGAVSRFRMLTEELRNRCTDRCLMAAQA